MKKAIAVLVLLGGMSVVSAISGISSVSTSTSVGTSVALHPDLLSQLLAGTWGVLLLALAFGIYRRLLLAWHAGWALLIICFVGLIVVAFPVILASEPRPPTWFLAFSLTFVVLGSVGAMLYWGRWWNRQRSYFGEHDG